MNKKNTSKQLELVFKNKKFSSSERRLTEKPTESIISNILRLLQSDAVTSRERSIAKKKHTDFANTDYYGIYEE
jgi:hypothetical protein